MGAFFVYIIKSAVCLAVFYLFYRLLLSKETFHRFNRIALLGILVLSCVIPFVEVTVKEPMEVSQQFLSLEELLLMAEMNASSVADEATPMVAFTWKEVMLLVYLAGIVFFFCRNLCSLGRMLNLIRGSRVVKQENGITLIAHQKDIAPFSWMKFVVISEKDLEENGREILTHEYAHIRKRHSVDLLIADICIFFQWFNPASWLLKQELQNIHEYEADESVINHGVDAKQYQLLLIKKAVGTRLYSMANSFNHSSLKKRITMMLKEKSSPWARLKYLYILPLAAVAMAAFARPEVSKELDEISSVKVNDLAAIVKAEEVKSFESQPVKEIKLKGQVREKENNEPVVGASVIIKGTTSGTISDKEGNFVITTSVGETLVVSFVDCKPKEVVIPGGKTENMVITLDIEERKKMPQHVPEPVEKPVLANDVFQVVEEMPEFPGGMAACLKFMGENIRYPEVAHSNGVQGKVIVQFVVEEDGSITSPEVVRAVDPYLDAEALRVIMTMPKWKPGKQRGQAVKVKYTIPVSFKLMDGEGTDSIRVIKEGMNVTSIVEFVNLHYRGEEPLILVDGMETDKVGLQKLRSDAINSIEVKKNEEAIAKYGDKGKNGVVLITTKTN
ncbi:TonB family protein [Phocaeicola sp.]